MYTEKANVETFRAAAKKAFALAKELGLVEDKDYQTIFSDYYPKNKQQERRRNEELKRAMEAGLEEVFSLQFQTVDKIYDDYINGLDISVETLQVKELDKFLANLIEFRVARKLASFLKKTRKIKFFSVPEIFTKRLNELLSIKDKIRIEDDPFSQTIIVHHKNVTRTVSYGEAGIEAVALDVIRIVNKLLEESGAADRIVFHGRSQLMRIPATKVRLEDNPFLPFYYQTNLAVLGQDKAAQADLDRALEHYSMPPLDGGKWVSQFLGKVPEKYLRPSGWDESYKMKGIGKPRLESEKIS